MVKGSLAVVATAHGLTHAPDGMFLGLLSQVRRPDTVYLGVSKVEEMAIPPLPFLVVLSVHPDKQDYGYDKRRQLLKTVEETYVTFMCHDDSYDRQWLERAVAILDAGEADVVYCAWNDIPKCTFAPASSTLGNFVVRTRLAQRVGFPLNGGNSDASMIDALNRLGARVKRIDDVMYFHNVPVLPIPISEWGVMKDKAGGKHV